MSTTKGRLVLTLRARDKETGHANAYNEALSGPDVGKVAKIALSSGVRNAEHEHAEGHEKGTSADDPSEMTGVQKTSNRCRQEQNDERLR